MSTAAPPNVPSASLNSARARETFLAAEWAPLFRGGWRRAVFIHFAMDPARLQRLVPYELDLWKGEAYVSLVAFTLEGMRLGPLPESLCRWLLRAVSPCRFLNVRTYVRAGANDGIFFLAEWLSNRWSVSLGRPLYGLPYRAGELGYGVLGDGRQVRGRVTSRSGNALFFTGEMEPGADVAPAAPGSREEFLLERYTAFTECGGTRRLFRVWHPPWPHAPLELELHCATLLTETGDWCRHARYAGAHYSPGFPEVWIGRPRRID